MPATVAELARGITGTVTREDAKKLARLHGHPWKSVLKAMKRRARIAGQPPASRLLDDYIKAQPEPSIAEAINEAATLVAKYGGIPGYAIADGVEVTDGKA